MKTVYRIAVVYQNRVTFAPRDQVWRQESIEAPTDDEAIAKCRLAHAGDPQERQAIAFAVIGASHFPED